MTELDAFMSSFGTLGSCCQGHVLNVCLGLMAGFEVRAQNMDMLHENEKQTLCLVALAVWELY